MPYKNVSNPQRLTAKRLPVPKAVAIPKPIVPKVVAPPILTPQQSLRQLVTSPVVKPPMTQRMSTKTLTKAPVDPLNPPVRKPVAVIKPKAESTPLNLPFKSYLP